MGALEDFHQGFTCIESVIMYYVPKKKYLKREEKGL